MPRGLCCGGHDESGLPPGGNINDVVTNTGPGQGDWAPPTGGTLAESWALYGLDGGSYVLSANSVFVPWQEYDLVGADIELDPDGHTIRILTAGLYGALAWMDLFPSAGNADGAVYCYYGGNGPWLSQSKTEIVPIRPTADVNNRGVTVPLPLSPCWCSPGDTLNVTAQTSFPTMAVGTVMLSDLSTVLQIVRLA